MKRGLFAKHLISAMMATILLLYFMVKSSSPKLIFIPFLICSISMMGKSIARILEKKRMEIVFSKLFVLGFLLFFIGFLAVAAYVSVRDKNYSLLICSIPFWIAGVFLIRKKLLDRKEKKDGSAVLSFAVVVSAILVAAALLAGIFLLVRGIKNAELGLLFGGMIFTFGSLTFVLAALTQHGCFEKVKIDVLGLYAGAAIAVIGLGFILLQFRESGSMPKRMVPPLYIRLLERKPSFSSFTRTIPLIILQRSRSGGFMQGRLQTGNRWEVRTKR